MAGYGYGYSLVYISRDPETRPAWGNITEIPLHVMSICAGLRYSEC